MTIHLQRDSEDLLRNEIQRHELQRFTEAILAVARESIALVVGEELSEIQPGQSRIGGPPDLEDESQWPKFNSGDVEEALSVFYFQINLSDLPYVIGGCLPEQGLLSLFSDSQLLAEDGAVLYFPQLNRLAHQRLPAINEFADEDLDEQSNRPVCFVNPRSIVPKRCISIPGYLFCPDGIQDDDLDRYFELMRALDDSIEGQDIGLMYSHVYQGVPEEDDPSWFSLFNLHSDSDYFSFGDCGNTAVSLLRSSAKAGDFSHVQFDYCECD